MKLIIQLIKLLPWIIILGLVAWIYFAIPTDKNPVSTITNHSILQEIEKIGKVELVKYNFKEITEVKKLSREYLKIFKLGPDSKIALISMGEAVGCIDLTKIAAADIINEPDTVFVKLPEPELCYYKLDLDKTHIYSIQTNPMVDEKEFIQSAYKSAESEIKQAALNSGILEQTYINAELILGPLLEKICLKKVVFTNRPKAITIEEIDG